MSKYTRCSINVAEVQIFPVCLVFKGMDQVWISRGEPGLGQNLVLFSILAFQMEAKVYNRGNHTSVACQVNTPCNMVSWSIPVKENLRTWSMLVELNPMTELSVLTNSISSSP